MPTVVIGLGNPVLCDDSAGLRVAQDVGRMLGAGGDTQVREIYGGGLRLMEAIAGYDRAILIDSITGTGAHPGTVRRLTLHDVLNTRNTCSTHDSSLAVAFELGRMAGMTLPHDVSIWAIEAADVTTFTEELTDAVRDAVPQVARGVIEELRGQGEGKWA